MWGSNPWLFPVSVGIVGSVLASELIYYLYAEYFCARSSKAKAKEGDGREERMAAITRKYMKKEKENLRTLEERKPREVWNTALFFPDEAPDDPNSPINRLLWFIDNARISIHICMYLTSNPRFVNVIKKKSSEGLVIQVVTDYDTFNAHNNFGPRIWSQRGMEVRMKNMGFLMHHKFLVIDEEAVITGSLNWTKQGVSDNYENVMITTNHNIVAKYMEEFWNLWSHIGSEGRIPEGNNY